MRVTLGAREEGEPRRGVTKLHTGSRAVQDIAIARTPQPSPKRAPKFPFFRNWADLVAWALGHFPK